jgi:hypothetical protein
MLRVLRSSRVLSSRSAPRAGALRIGTQVRSQSARRIDGATRPRSARWWWIIPAIHAGAYALWARPTDALHLWISISFLTVSAVSSYALFSDPRPYSINRIYWLFHLVFFALAPSYQTAVGAYPWGSEDITLPAVLRANLVVLAGMAAYHVGRYIAEAAGAGNAPRVAARVDDTYRRAHRSWGAAIFLIIAVVYVSLAGLRNIWLKGELDELLGEGVPNAVYLTVEKLVRGPVLYYALASILLFRLRKIKAPFLAWVLTVFFVVNFPLVLPRALMAACYVGVALSFGGALWLRKPQLFSLGLIALIIGIYPLMSLARWNTEEADRRFSDLNSYVSQSYVGGDFDAHVMVCRTVEYVRRNGTSNGRQLLTALAFPVPRKVWPQKSIGSGALVHTALRKEWTNVSSPLPAEGYINFGLLGALLFSALFAAGAQRYDAYYWAWRTRRAGLGDFSFPILFYPVVLVLSAFVLRGDLLSSLASGVGLYAAAYLTHALLRLNLLQGRWWGR